MAQQGTCMSVEEARQLIMDHRYIIDRFVGAGAMACVYKARERDTPNIYALKVLREEYFQKKGFVEIFEKEALHMRDLQYPNMVRFYKFVNEEHLAYILMDYVEGKPLTDYIREARHSEKMIPLDTIVRMMAQISRAINYLHDAGIIHRDIKPGNILLAGENQSAFLTDLGIAGAFDAQEELGGAGTPSYMPYEQQIGQNVDHTVDIYAFAIMLFEVFTSRKPFLPRKGLDIKEARQAMRELHRSGDIPSIVELRPELPEELDEIFQHALAKEPSERYKDVMDFAQDIHEHLKSRLSDDLKNFADIKAQEIERPQNNKPIRATASQETVAVEQLESRNPQWFTPAIVIAVLLVVSLAAIWMATQNSAPVEATESQIVETRNTSSTEEVVAATQEPVAAQTESQMETPVPGEMPFFKDAEITMRFEDSSSLWLGEDWNASLAFAVQNRGNYIPLLPKLNGNFHLEFSLAEGTASDYLSYGIVFAYQNDGSYRRLRIDTESQQWLLEALPADAPIQGDIEGDLPRTVSVSLYEGSFLLELDGQAIQFELDESVEGQLGLWLEIEDTSAIRMPHLRIELYGDTLENLDKYNLLQDIENFLATGDGATFDIQCADFNTYYDKLGDYADEANGFDTEVVDLAESALDFGVLIHGECNAQETVINVDFDAFAEWEKGIKDLLKK